MTRTQRSMSMLILTALGGGYAELTAQGLPPLLDEYNWGRVWQTTPTGYPQTKAKAVVPVPTGGVMVVGERTRSGGTGGDLNILFSRLDPFGTLVSQAEFEKTGPAGGTQTLGVECAIRTVDGKYVVCGSTQSGTSGLDMYVLKHSGVPNSPALWFNLFHSSSNDQAFAVQEYTDAAGQSRVVVAGYRLAGTGNRCVWLLVLDGATGAIANNFSYDFHVFGWAPHPPNSDASFLYLKVNGLDGQPIATRVYRSAAEEQCNAAYYDAQNSQFVLCGTTSGGRTQRSDLDWTVVAIDANTLNVNWANRYGGPVGVSNGVDDAPVCIALVPAIGGYYVGGSVGPGGIGPLEGLIVRLTPQGVVNGWANTYGSYRDDGFLAFALEPWSTYLCAVGYSTPDCATFNCSCVVVPGMMVLQMPNTGDISYRQDLTCFKHFKTNLATSNCGPSTSFCAYALAGIATTVVASARTAVTSPPVPGTVGPPQPPYAGLPLRIAPP